MQKLISKEHKSHLKKRAILEIIGLVVLVYVCINQKDVISIAIRSIREADVFYLTILLLFYWLLLPVATFNYRLLTSKKLSVFRTSLAQLAGAGPARIIPGGLGQVSIGIIYLQKIGLKLRDAVLIVVTNNAIGIIMNLALLSVAILFHPTILSTIRNNLTGRHFLVIGLIILTIFMALYILSHARATKKTVRKFESRWSSELISLRKDPRKLILMMINSSLITIGHTLMIMLSAKALSVNVSFSDGLIALSAGVFIGGVIPTPGGLGAVEAGIMSALVLLGYSSAEATSIALLFRSANYWQPIIPGIFAYLYLREKKLL